MRAARRSRVALVLALASLTPAGVAGQQSTSPARSARVDGWVAPRTADGRPDLEGVWENNSATPLERPRQLADSTYSQNWLPDRYFEHRTSLIVDPADGKLPAPTAAGARVRAAALGRFGRPAAAAQDMTLQDRCIHYGFPDLFAAYMSAYRIVQTPEYVAIQMEKIHDARIIPLDPSTRSGSPRAESRGDGRPRLSSSLRHYLGDSRGRWEGDTLVVETTNFHPNGNPMGGYLTLSDENLRLVERFRRIADDTLEYTFTVDNPTMWTKPWTAVINWKRSRGELHEYACHEGNYSLRGMLSAARADEAAGR
jgi:hypothetical protein